MFHKLRFILSIVVILLSVFTYGQNFVSDGDFIKPLTNDTITRGWHKCGFKDSPDFFVDSNVSVFKRYRGGTTSYSGNSHVGIFVYRKAMKGKTAEIREFLCGSLTQPLKRDSFYTVQVFVKPDEESNVECDGFVIAVTDENIQHKSTEDIYRMRSNVARAKNDFILNNETWTGVNGTFQARGG